MAERSGLQIDQVSLQFGDTRVLDDLTLEIPGGELLAIVGPSGGGKTTLLRVIAGLLTPTAGSIRIAGQSVDALAPHRRGVAMMFQGPSLYPHRTVRQNLAAVAAWPAQTSSAFASIESMAIDMGIGDQLDQFPDSISGGQQRRAAVIKCLAARQRISLLDEPLTALNPSLVNHMIGLIRRWHDARRSQGAVTICVTHEFDSAMRLGDRIAVIDRGKILQIGTAEQLAQEPQHQIVATTCAIDLPQSLSTHVLEGSIPAAAKVITFAASTCRPATELTTPAVTFDVVAARPLGLSRVELTIQTSDASPSGDQGSTYASIVAVISSGESHPSGAGRWGIPLGDATWFDESGRRVSNDGSFKLVV